METISNAASAAARAVWGEGEEKTEPVSGQQGDTSKGEPYDAGNLESSKEPQNEVIKENPETKNSGGEKTEDNHNEETEDNRDEKTEDNRDEKTEDVKDDGEPSSEIKGPGPRPLETVAKEMGGDAGNISNPSANSAPENGADGEGEDKNGNKGTGEEVVKATGFAADGGDFDATNPGAAREADRLLEEKGAGRGSGDPVAPNTGDLKEDTTSGKEKKKGSLKERIKAKFQN